MRALTSLRVLNLERNGLEMLQASGSALTHLHLRRNRLSTLRGSVSPSPAALRVLEADENALVDLPDWLSDCLHLGGFSLFRLEHCLGVRWVKHVG